MRPLVFALALALAACGGEESSPADAPAKPPTPTAVPPAAARLTHGKSVANGQCNGCHGRDVYTRPDRKVQDARMLDAQVDTCGDAAGIDDATKQDVKEYLAREVYGFAG